jgi:hypothetical protein
MMTVELLPADEHNQRTINQSLSNDNEFAFIRK